MTDLALGRIGLGTAPLGNLYAEVTEEDARATVDAAWDAGIRLFDTAPLYGHGLAERRLGAALAAHPRDELVISTKVGRLLQPGVPEPEGAFRVSHGEVPRFDFSADGVRRSLDESLGRLGVDRVDIVLIHDPDAHLGAGDQRGGARARGPARGGRGRGDRLRHELRRAASKSSRALRPRRHPRRRSLHAARPGRARLRPARGSATNAGSR